MPRIEKTVFISYRRTNAPWALAIYQYLTHHGYDVFYDYQGIASGDFEQVILENIKARAHFIVVLTPSALKLCEEPGDWLRREIETALETRRNIVPLMLEGFNFGSPGIAQYLAGEFAALKGYDGLNVSAESFEEAMARLREHYLNVPLEAVLHSVPSAVQEAVKQQQAAADSAPTVAAKEFTAQEWFERGYTYEDAGRHDEAIDAYSEALRLEPDDALVYYNRGLAHYAKGDLDGALHDYNDALRLAPDDANAYHNRGIARYDKGDLDGALRDYDAALRLAPEDADAYNNRGIARKARGDLDGALRDYDEALRLKPDDAFAYNNRGNARKARGDLDGAIRDYDEALRLYPDYADVYNNRGAARDNKGDFDGALRDYNEALRLNPDYADAYYNRGTARDDKGDLDGALRDYDEALRLKPDHAHAYYNRGLAREAKGNVAGAIADYQKYLDLGGGLRDGDLEEVEQIIRDLQK